jgi:hypothetical protein
VRADDRLDYATLNYLISRAGACKFLEQLPLRFDPIFGRIAGKGESRPAFGNEIGAESNGFIGRSNCRLAI